MSYPGAQRNTSQWDTPLYSTADGTRPAAGMGASVTPNATANTYGTPVTLISGASLIYDCCDLFICVNNVATSAVARDCVVALLTDPAGGTSYSSIADLVCGPASGYVVANVGGGGVCFRFPLWIRAGTSIGVAAAVNSATVTAINAFCRVSGRPSDPDTEFVGTYLDQYGVSLATSAGTVVTPGGASEGAYTLIGTLTRPAKVIDFGVGINDATMTAATIDFDIAIGDGTTNRVVIPNKPVFTSGIEASTKSESPTRCKGATGQGIYARAQCSTTPDSNYSVAAYVVG